VAIELQWQLFAWESELDSKEGAIVAWENCLAAFECTLEGHAQNTMSSAIEPRLSDKTIRLGYTLLRLVAAAPSTSTQLWRNAESFLPYRRWT
jgi:hypothetical protein